MKVYVCAIAKNEHLYINEWVAHYVKLGVDKIYIYDNDDKGTPDIYKSIDRKYSKYLVFVNVRGQHFSNIQGTIYTQFYQMHKDMFDWCLFCDIDEFLTGVDNIKVFLNRPYIRNTYQVRVKWKLFGDDNLIERDMSKGVMETFKQEIKVAYTRDLKRQCDLPNQAKSIVKGHLSGIEFVSVHFASTSKYKQLLPSILPNGKVCKSGVALKESYDGIPIFLNHYMTKSLSEFVKQKLNRTDAVFGDRHLKLNYYWRINKKTKAKQKYLKDMGLE